MITFTPLNFLHLSGFQCIQKTESSKKQPNLLRLTGGKGEQTEVVEMMKCPKKGKRSQLKAMTKDGF